MSALVQATNQAPDLIKGLAPAFVAGFSIQQLLEILDQFLILIPTTCYEKHKKAILGILALIIGWGITVLVNLRMLQALGLNTDARADNLVTAIFISAGTAGFNSIVKYLNYAKENKKGHAQQNQAAAHTNPRSDRQLSPWLGRSYKTEINCTSVRELVSENEDGEHWNRNLVC